MSSEAEKRRDHMNSETPAIEINQLTRRYGKLEAVNNLSLAVRRGRCYGFFGRNGAGKTTTIKCLLNLLRPNSGTVRVLGLDPQRQEVPVKSRLTYVPDSVDRFQLDPSQKASELSKGQKTQLALIGDVCPEPELLVLDEPTSGLDPIVRREFNTSNSGSGHTSPINASWVFCPLESSLA